MEPKKVKSTSLPSDYLQETLDRDMKKMRGELFTLVDAITDDPTRRNAIKDLIRGFTSDCWGRRWEKIREFLKNKGLPVKEHI